MTASRPSLLAAMRGYAATSRSMSRRLPSMVTIQRTADDALTTAGVLRAHWVAAYRPSQRLDRPRSRFRLVGSVCLRKLHLLRWTSSERDGRERSFSTTAAATSVAAAHPRRED